MLEDTGPFAIGEKVLVPHTDKYYEAKVLKAEYRDDKMWYYFLHYTGWNKKWDEWVEETGLQKNQGADGSGGKKIRRSGGQGGLKKRRLDEIGGASVESSVQLDLEIPAALKKILVEDHEAVVSGGRLVPLPRRPTVHEVLQQYVEEAVVARNSADTEDEIAHGLRTYFDKALGQCLLYPSERAQHQQATSSGKCPSHIYGAEHLLRLFVKLPELLPVREDRAGALRDCLHHVLAFLLQHQSQFFLPTESYTAGLGGPPPIPSIGMAGAQAPPPSSSAPVAATG